MKKLIISGRMTDGNDCCHEIYEVNVCVRLLRTKKGIAIRTGNTRGALEKCMERMKPRKRDPIPLNIKKCSTIQTQQDQLSRISLEHKKQVLAKAKAKEKNRGVPATVRER